MPQITVNTKSPILSVIMVKMTGPFQGTQVQLSCNHGLCFFEFFVRGNLLLQEETFFFSVILRYN